MHCPHSPNMKQYDFIYFFQSTIYDSYDHSRPSIFCLVHQQIKTTHAIKAIMFKQISNFTPMRNRQREHPMFHTDEMFVCLSKLSVFLEGIHCLLMCAFSCKPHNNTFYHGSSPKSRRKEQNISVLRLLNFSNNRNKNLRSNR